MGIDSAGAAHVVTSNTEAGAEFYVAFGTMAKLFITRICCARHYAVSHMLDAAVAAMSVAAMNYCMMLMHQDSLLVNRNGSATPAQAVTVHWDVSSGAFASSVQSATNAFRSGDVCDVFFTAFSRTSDLCAWPLVCVHVTSKGDSKTADSESGNNLR